MSLKFSVLLSVVVAALGASTYNYDRCDIIPGSDGAVGPLFWGLIDKSVCGTILSPQKEGTPINLCGASAFPGTAPTPVLSASYSASRTMNASNTGSSLYWYVNDNAPTLQMGDLAYTVNRTTDSSTQTWILEQIHPHWGRDGRTNEGSEHYMQGVAYPMEVHLVHYNSKYSDFMAAVTSGNKDALLVVGVMMQLGSTDLNIVTVLANQISSLTQKKTPLPSQVQVTDFFDGTGSYYSYRGSLTTPGCLEIVTWVVMKGTKSITEATLNKFKAATINPAAAGKKFNTLATAGTYGVFGNYRPIQPLQGRSIYVSDGASVACAAYTEAQATCTSGVLFSGPSVVIQLLALALALTVASRE